MKTSTVYIIQYNDRFGNGDDKKYEGVVRFKKDFQKWFRKHNKERKTDGEEPELRMEFDLIEVTFFESE